VIPIRKMWPFVTAMMLSVVATRVSVYAQAPETWTLTSPTPLQMANHTSTTLADGRVLTAGGGSLGYYATKIVQLYQPATDQWTVANPLRTARKGHTATLLANGKVLVNGGLDVITFPNVTVFNSAELYNATTGKWTATGRMLSPRVGHSATLLADGRVFVCGGIPAIYPRTPYWTPVTDSAEIYNPSSGAWSPAGVMSTPRYGHAAVLLNNGQVLVAGGYERSGRSWQTAELYDPASKTWSAAGALNARRYTARAVQLQDGRVLLIGTDTSVELYDPTTNVWTFTGSLPWTPSSAPLLLANGNVLVTGGDASTTESVLYDPASGLWTLTGSFNVPRTGYAASVLSTGRVLVSGGAYWSGSAEFYTPLP
jgi:N-acetylneuraminic acid mutarotase